MKAAPCGFGNGIRPEHDARARPLSRLSSFFPYAVYKLLPSAKALAGKPEAAVMAGEPQPVPRIMPMS